MVRILVLARVLSPADFGLMAMVLVFINFAQTYTDLGISAAIVHRQDATAEQLASLYWTNVATGILTFLFTWLATPLITQVFHEPRLVPLLRAAAVAFIIGGATAQFETLLLRDLRFRLLAFPEITSSLASLLLGVTLALSGFGVWSLVLAFIGGVAVESAALLLLGFSAYRPLLHFRASDLKAYLQFGLYQMGERLMNCFSARIDQILIARLLGAQALGYYVFAFNLSYRPIWRINPLITRIAFPLFAKVQDDRERLRRGYLRMINVLTTINAPLLIGLASVAPLLVPVVFGSKWMPSVILIQLLSLSGLQRSIFAPIGTLQNAKGRADLGFKWHSMLCAASVPLIYAGAKWNGVVGVAGILMVLPLALGIPFYFLMLRPLIGRCGSDYAVAIFKPIAAAFAMSFAVAMVSLLPSGAGSAWMLGTEFLVGAVVYCVVSGLTDKKGLTELRIIFSRS